MEVMDQQPLVMVVVAVPVVAAVVQQVLVALVEREGMALMVFLLSGINSNNYRLKGFMKGLTKRSN